LNLLLVDDHALFRDGLAMLLAHHWPAWKLQCAGSLAEALAAVHGHADLSLAVLDLALPDSAGLEGLARLREAAPELTVVVVSADERRETVLAAIDAGAAGFIGKSADSAGFMAALRTVLSGGVWLPASVLGDGPAPPSEGEEALKSLTPRQRDVLWRVLEGKPNKLICRDLDMAPSTVKTHLAEIYRRLGVRSRTQAVVAAARLGLRLERVTLSR
jgi:DNA-binding NarL/FixJ family response regulator